MKIITALCTLIILAGCQDKMAAQTHEKNREHDMTHTIYTGGYTGPGADQSKGIYRIDFNPTTRVLSNARLAITASNPSWLEIEGENIYAVNELEEGTVQLFQNGTLLQTVATEGGSPCHVKINRNGHYFAVANYMGGNIAVYERDPKSGLLKANPQTRQHIGSGPNKDRQEAAHAHWVGWGNNEQFFYVVDLGIDRIMAYPFDSATGALGKSITAYQAPLGAGPRHILFHPKSSAVYILNELDNTVVVAEQTAEGLIQAKQTLSTLPNDFTAHSQAAHIALNAAGTHLYVSNRGHDSIAVFEIGQDSGLSLKQLVPTEGHWPRHFALLEESQSLLVANEQSNSVVAFEIAKDGSLISTGERISVSAPTFIGFD
ncbi:lactonase family protein [Teredinibacter purpureus]|uniref:lactonase family protein n=1 Tax=Teredinibacter purpureus TaxID=2731756 RepID=UPI00069844EC|nr:lactonase family protein [Teredinibacter purpureus]